MSIHRADIIMMSSKKPFLLYPRWKKLTLFWLITLTKLKICS